MIFEIFSGKIGYSSSDQHCSDMVDKRPLSLKKYSLENFLQDNFITYFEVQTNLTHRRPMCHSWHIEMLFSFHGSTWTSSSNRWRILPLLKHERIINVFESSEGTFVPTYLNCRIFFEFFFNESRNNHKWFSGNILPFCSIWMSTSCIFFSGFPWFLRF